MAEIILCSNCQRKLQVPDQYLGQTVQCPECGQMFVASATTVSATPVAPASTPPPGDAGRRSKPRGYEDEEDDYPKRPRRRFEEDEDDDFDRSPRIRHDYAPHRGGLIIALGLVSLVGGWLFCLPIVVGPFAWIMGSTDLRAMRAGAMDPAGESMTRTGQVCGIISTVILIAAAVVIFFVILGEVGHF